MCRSDREVKEFEDIVAIMEKCDVCRIALNNNGYLYILPLNFEMCIKEGKIESGFKEDLCLIEIFHFIM